MTVVVQDAVQDKTGALLVKLKEGVTNLISSQKWKEYLRVQSRFHKYSAGNVMLIMAQRPDASRVAGYNHWKELGRYVKKGERGIAIFAPVTYKIKAEDDDAEFTRLVGFKVVYTFDISQTDGKELPDHPSTLLDTIGTESLMQTMLAVANKLDITVRIGDAHGANGYYNHATNEIIVSDSVPLAQKTKTLIHELAHSCLHATWVPDISRSQREVEAESAAYIVSQYYGLDSADYSFGYVATWSKADPESVVRYGERIRKAATKIIDLAEHIQK
jgi:antirestriction protein ArdC